MSTYALGRIVLLVVAILSLLLIIFFAVSLISGVAGYAPDSLCKANAAMNSLTPFNKWAVSPNFACYVKEVPIDVGGSDSFFSSAFGNFEACACNQFYGAGLKYIPINLIDDDYSTSTLIPVEEDKSSITLYMSGKFNLSKLHLNFSHPINANYTIITKQKNFFWTSYKPCATGKIIAAPPLNSILFNDTLNCSVDDKVGGIKILLTGINESKFTNIEATEIRVYNVSGSKIPIEKLLFTLKRPNTLENECISDRKAAGIDGCTPEWKRKWVEKRLLEVALRCWKMGAKGNFYGDFDCFSGCVYYNSSAAGDINYFTLNQSLQENSFYDHLQKTYVPYSTALPLGKLAIEKYDYLEDKRCYFMKYHRSKERDLALPLGTTGVVYTINLVEDHPMVIVAFGRTVAEAREEL